MLNINQYTEVFDAHTFDISEAIKSGIYAKLSLLLTKSFDKFPRICDVRYITNLGDIIIYKQDRTLEEYFLSINSIEFNSFQVKELRLLLLLENKYYGKRN